MRNFPKFTLRISNHLHQKLKYMAQYNGRSENREIEAAIKRYIKDFERLHGNIEIDDDFED